MARSSTKTATKSHKAGVKKVIAKTHAKKPVTAPVATKGGKRAHS